MTVVHPPPHREGAWGSHQRERRLQDRVVEVLLCQDQDIFLVDFFDRLVFSESIKFYLRLLVSGFCSPHELRHTWCYQ